MDRSSWWWDPDEPEMVLIMFWGLDEPGEDGPDNTGIS